MHVPHVSGPFLKVLTLSPLPVPTLALCAHVDGPNVQEISSRSTTGRPHSYELRACPRGSTDEARRGKPHTPVLPVKWLTPSKTSRLLRRFVVSTTARCCMIGCNVGSTRNSTRAKKCAELAADYITPTAKLFKKPYGKWTAKERAWLEKEYKRSRLTASPRGRPRDSVYDALLHEREMAKLSGINITYWEQASKIPDKSDRPYRRQRIIRASQRRQRIFSSPPKD